MDVIYAVLGYFDLDISPEILLLGKKEEPEAQKRRRNKRRFWLTLAMYVGVYLGVIGENVVSWFNTGKSPEWSSFEVTRFLVALIVTTVIFPQVFTRVFAEGLRQKKMTATDRFLQFCVAFQNGYFWPSLIRAISQIM